MMKLLHRIRLIKSKIEWFFKIVYFAMIHSRQVKNYEFLIESKNKALLKLLEAERKEIVNEDEILKLKTQIDLLTKIINYVSK